MHSLLERQLQEHFGSTGDIPAEWQSFVAAVDQTYQNAHAGLAEELEAQGHVLLDVIQSVALGDLDVAIDIPEGIEVISDLAIGLEMMVDDIREMIADQMRAREEIERARRDLDVALQQVLAVQRRYIREGWETYREEHAGTAGYALIDGQAGLYADAWLPAMTAAVESGESVTGQEKGGCTLALPLQFYGEVLGVLGFAREAEEGWSEEELSTVRAVVDQVAQALENQRLLDEQQRIGALMAKRVNELNCLSDVGRKLDESPDIPALLTWVAERIPAATQYPQECLVAVEFRGQVYGAAEAQALPRQIVQGLRVGSELVGQIYVAYVQEHDFLNEESALLGDVARRVSGYIESQRLLEQTRATAEQFRVLYELAQTLTAQLEMDQVLDQVYRGVSRLIDTTNFYIGLYEPEQNRISFPFNVTESVIDREIVTISADAGISGYIIRTGQSLLIGQDVDRWMQEHEIATVGEAARCFLSVPLLIGGRVQGLIAVQDYHRANVYTEQDQTALAAIASQASIAIQNARLFAQAQARAQSEQVLRQIVSRVRGSTDPDVIARAAVRELGTALGRRAFIRLGSAEALAQAQDRDG